MRSRRACEQVPDAVKLILDRIRQDPRHEDLRVLRDELDDARAFGDWAMASLPAERDQELVHERVHRMLRNAPRDVLDAFSDAGLV